MSKLRRLVGTSVFAVAIGASGAALAQSTQAQTDNTETSRSTDEDEIIVTARKRDERLQDVPVAVTALGAEALERYATGSVFEIATQVPQLVLSQPSGPAGGSVNLRGVGSATTSPAVDQSVALNIDGVQLSQSNAMSLGIYDLARVEVLRGPQALFFGKNSPGGVISLVSEGPSDVLEWRVRGAYDVDVEGYLTEGMVSLPISDFVGLRLVAAYRGQSGSFDNTPSSIPGQTFSNDSYKDAQEYFVRGVLAFGDANDDFNATLRVSYADQDRNNGLFSGQQLFDCPGGAPAFTGFVPGSTTDCSIDENYSEPDISAGAATLFPLYRDGRPYYENTMSLAALTANYRIGEHWTVTSITGLFDYDEQWTSTYNSGGVVIVYTGSDMDQEQFTQELRLASDLGGPFDVVLGGFYQDAELNLEIPTALGEFFAGGPSFPIDDALFTQNTEAWSIFGQLIWRFAPQWELAGGARYSHEEKEESGSQGLAGLPYDFIDPARSFNNISPEVTLSYRPTTDLTIYAAYREGFTSGGFNLVPLAFAPGVPVDNGFDQSTVSGGEVGVRGSIGDGQLRYDLTAYRYDYQDLQLSAVDAGTISLFIRNAAEARIQGLEASLTYRPAALEDLTLRTNVGYNDATFTDFDTAQCYTGQTLALGCNGNLIAGVGTTQDLSGFPLERAPEWTVNFGGTYDHQLQNGMSISVSADAFYTGEFFAQPEHDPRSMQDEAWRFNAALEVSGQREGWSLALIGRNLTDELRAEYAFGQPLTGGGTGTPAGALSDLVGVVSEPRSVLLQLTLRDTLLH